MQNFNQLETLNFVREYLPHIKDLKELIINLEDNVLNMFIGKINEGTFSYDEVMTILKGQKIIFDRLYTEKFSQVYLNREVLPQNLREYFVNNDKSPKYLGKDLYAFKIQYLNTDDILFSRIKDVVLDVIKNRDLDSDIIKSTLEKELIDRNLEKNSLNMLVERKLKEFSKDDILKTVNSVLRDMDLADTDSVEVARVKAIVAQQLNTLSFDSDRFSDSVQKEFQKIGLNKEKTQKILSNINEMSEFKEDILSKLEDSKLELKTQIQKVFEEKFGNISKENLDNIKDLEPLLRDFNTTMTSKIEEKVNSVLTSSLETKVTSILTPKLEELKSSISSEVDQKINAKFADISADFSPRTDENKVNELIDAKISSKVNSDDIYPKSEIYNKSEVYSKSEVDAKISEQIPDISLLAKKSELPSLENYYNKTETYSKSEVDAKVAAGGTFDASSYYQKSDIDSKVQELAKKSETYNKSEVYNKSEIDAKIPNVEDFAKKSETYNKSEVDGKFQNIQTGTNEEKVNELIDAKLNPVKTSLFTENAADAKYQTKENAFTKEKADELYLSKTAELKLKGQTSEEISDTDEIPFRTDENSPIKFVAVSKIKGQSGGDLTKPEVEKEVKSQLGAFSLGDGYAIAKALKPYLPNTLRIPDRITTKQLQNFKIKFDLFKAPDGYYGSAMSALLFSRDLVPFYPIYRAKMTSTKRSVFILSQTGKKLTKEEFDALSEVPENYVLKDNELKIELSIEGTINPYDYTTYSPDNIFIGHKGTGTGYYSMSSTSETTIPYTFVLSISSKNSNYFDTMSFYNGATQGRYSDRIKVTMLNNEEEIFKKMYSELPNNCSLETIIQLKPRDLVKALPDTEENKVIEILKEYNKQYIDEKVKANELVNKADLHNELTNNIQETISTEATKIDIVQKMNQVLAYNLKNMAIDYALIPTEKPKETTFIIKDTTRYSTSYGAGFNEIIIFDEDGNRLYLTKCSPNNAKLVDIILSKNPVSTSYDIMQSSGIPESYVLEAGEYRGTIEAKYGYDYLGRFLYGDMNSSLGSYNDEFLKIKIKGLYPSKIRIVSRKDGYYFTDYTVVARNEDGQTIGIKKYSNMLVGNVSEFYTPKIQKSDTITDFTTILDGENAKKVIKSNVDTAVEEKFNNIDFLSSQNLETKINDLMPKIVEKFGDNDGFKNYMKKAFDIIDEDFPEDLKHKPTDFTFTIDKCIKKSGDLPCLGSVTLTDNNGKKLYLKATSQLRDTDKRISIILTTNEEDAITGESGNFIDTDNYQLKEGEYKAYIQSSNQYRNTDYYWCFYIFNLKAANKYNYYLMRSDFGSVTVTIKDFYPKSMTIYNTANDRYLDSYRVRFFDNETCFLNVRKTYLQHQTTSNIRIPTFE